MLARQAFIGIRWLMDSYNSEIAACLQVISK